MENIVQLVDIWKKNENQNEQNSQTDINKEITIKSPILSKDVNKIIIKIDEQKIDNSEQAIIGIFDPEDNNFSLNMWTDSDGEDIKKILGRINKLKLSIQNGDDKNLICFFLQYLKSLTCIS